MNKTILFCCVFSLVIVVHTKGQKLQWETVIPQTDASFRALSVVNDSVAWVAGTMGWVGKTINGGKNWNFARVKDFERFDFRSLYAFNGNVAIVANAGPPANVLITRDGGESWEVVFTHADTTAFFDGIDFWDENEGLVYGDPIRGRMLLVKTTDGGKSWVEIKSGPLLDEGEASFAASGTNIRCMEKSRVVIATGGRKSRLWESTDKGAAWRTIETPILQGESATGIFSFSGFRKRNAVIVGGDYTRDTLRLNHVFYTRDRGRTWKAPSKPTRGYRECVEYISDDFLIATGPGGTDVSSDGGISWESESDERLYHVIRQARTGSLVIIAGGKGKISILKRKP
jgi:photosystem II stability/assembly factor-like uncharacterized protein